MGPAVVVRVPGKAPFAEISVADLAARRAACCARGSIPLFATGWYRTRGSARFFEHPYLAAEVGEALLAAGVRTIAIDTLNADRTGGDEFPIHDAFAAAGGLIAENLAGTEELGDDDRAVPAPAAAQPGGVRRRARARRRTERERSN